MWNQCIIRRNTTTQYSNQCTIRRGLSIIYVCMHVKNLNGFTRIHQHCFHINLHHFFKGKKGNNHFLNVFSIGRQFLVIYVSIVIAGWEPSISLDLKLLGRITRDYLESASMSIFNSLYTWRNNFFTIYSLYSLIHSMTCINGIFCILIIPFS